MKSIVIIESPYAGDIEKNVDYLHRCMMDSINRFEAPFASHMVYPFYLDEDKPEEREDGIQLGFAWLAVAERQVFYIDNGFSEGMMKAFIKGQELGINQVLRKIL